MKVLPLRYATRPPSEPQTDYLGDPDPATDLPLMGSGYPPHSPQTIALIRKDIAELKQLLLDRDIVGQTRTPVYKSNFIFNVAKRQYKPSRIIKLRVVSIGLSSIAVGIALTLGFSTLSGDLWQGLFYMTFALPPLGVSSAAILSLFAGEQYDYSE